jgi:CMP-N-acetylneuraminic acid synthetase
MSTLNSSNNHQPRLLAVIPARGGSKRLPGKNIRKLGGRPLIAWSIDAAKSSGVFCDVVVSTDDPEIAEVAKAYGATVPFLRPKDLATDTAGSLAVLRHALGWYGATAQNLDGVALLQPTSPFRSIASIREAASEYGRHDFLRTLVTVSPAKSHPAWCFLKSENGMQPCLGWDSIAVRSQDLPPAYSLNGSIYIIPPSNLILNSPLLSDDTVYFVMENEQESIDIDSPYDWDLAVFFEAKFNK